MELTIESALSPGGLVGHTSYLLLVFSMLMRRMYLLRILVILSSFVAITYDIVWLKDPVGVFWETLLVLVNIIQLSITWVLNRNVRFSHEETLFMKRCLPSLSSAEQRKFLNQGIWINSESGTELTTQGVPVSQLIYLASGRANVTMGGNPVATSQPGSFVGEMTALDGDPASATVTLSEEARYWAIDAKNLRELIRKYPDIRSALQKSFTSDMRDKLIRSSQIIARSGGVDSQT